MSHQSKTCKICGRAIEWRRKWQDCWDEVQYCSERCRQNRMIDTDLERTILNLLEKRSRGATICPSKAARRHFGEDGWRGKMEEVRCAARRLVAQGHIQIMQGGRVVDPSTAKGPIRLRNSSMNY